MKKTIILLPILLIVNQAHSMELAPTFTPENKQGARPSLYFDEKAKCEFSSAITHLIYMHDSAALLSALKEYAHTHTQDAKTFWEYNKEWVIGIAKAERDYAMAVTNMRDCSELPTFSTSKITVGEIVRLTNYNLGYLKNFEAIIAAEKQLQTLQKKQ